MAYTKTINADQIFVRDIFFRDFGNRPISSGNILVTRGDGGVSFSNVSTNGVYAFNSIQADSVSTIYASNTGSNAINFGAGPGIAFAIDSNAYPYRLVISNLGIQQLYVFDNKSTLSFSSFTAPTPAGRVLKYAGEGEVYIRTSTNTVIFGAAYSSSYSSILYLESTVIGIEQLMSTNYTDYSTLLGLVNTYFLSTSVSSFYSTLTSVNDTTTYLSTFVFTTFADDGTGHHNTLNVSSIYTNQVSTNILNTNEMYTQVFAIGHTRLYDSTQFTSTNYCTTFVANGPLNAVENSFHITDDTSHVDIAFQKTAFSQVSTAYASTFTTLANQYQLGLTQEFSNAPNLNPILQQLEIIQIQVDDMGVSTVTNYQLKNSIVVDQICAPNDLNVTVGGNAYVSTFGLYTTDIHANSLNTSTILTSSITYNTAAGNTGYLSTLNISTIAGIASPILTFDPVNNRIGVNLGDEMPNATVDVSGVIIANNFVTLSDRRVKRNIQPLQCPKPIQSYSYEMEGFDDIGVIADEIEAIAPCCVYTRPDGYKAVSYPKLVPILLSYINDLRARVETIESEMSIGIKQ